MMKPAIETKSAQMREQYARRNPGTASHLGLRLHKLRDKLAETGSLNTFEVAALAKVSVRQLQWWHDSGYCSPAIKGHARKWNGAAVDRVLALASLRARGITPRRAALVLNASGMAAVDNICNAIDLLKEWKLWR